MASEPSELEAYLHRNIPISRAMGVRVAAVDGEGVRLTAPIAPNMNHRRTAFGGSVSTLAILSAWMLVHARLRESGSEGRVVIQRSSLEYLHPVHGDFEARGLPPAEESLGPLRGDAGAPRPRPHLAARGGSEGGRVAGRFHGAFVALIGPPAER